MGSLRLTLCAGALCALCAGAVALTGPAPTAYAADSGDITVVPAEPAPGSDIRVHAEGCGGRSGTASSAAFVADAQLTQLGGKGGELAGETRVRSTLAPGTYDVRVSCDGREEKAKGTITVGDGKPPTTKPSATEPAPHHPSVPASPVAPVRAGGGGAATPLAVDSTDPANSTDARHTGPGAPHTVIGLVLAGVAAVAVVARSARRRGRDRGTE